MIRIASKPAARAVLAAFLVTMAAACAPIAPQQAALPAHVEIACPALEGTPGCVDGFMPYP